MTHPNFSIQIHPHRAADLDIARVCSICETIARDFSFVTRFAASEGHDSHAYLNLNFQTSDIHALWQLLQERLYSGDVGAGLKRSSMAMCEGSHGWDDYILLHHYDPAVPCDDL